MLLSSLGWDATLASSFEQVKVEDESLVPGRVAADRGPFYRVLTEDGERLCTSSGRLRFEARSRAELPVVGDWVVVRPGPEGGGAIQGLLPRKTRFSRQLAGTVTDEQVLAANVDTVLLVMGLDGDFSPRRLERMLLLAWQGGVRPVIVLNKADVCDECDTRRREVDGCAGGAPILVTSAATGEGLAALDPFLLPGHTVALLGSSGVGKSTIVNQLLEEERQPTKAVREWDDCGRHTTTRRELFLLPGGALLVDTPGLRELQLWADEDGLAATFEDISAFAPACAFRDCTHTREPRCAVRRAVEEGRLPANRLESYFKLQAELRSFDVRHDLGAQAAERRRWRPIHKAARRHRFRE